MKTVNKYSGFTTVELAPEHIDLIITLMSVVQSYSSGTMLELREQLTESCPHIDDAIMEQYTDDCIDSLRRLVTEAQSS